MSGLAAQLIAENISTKATFLDLGNCGLNEIPAEVSDLVWLKHLSLASEWSEWDGENWLTKKSRNAGQQNRLADLALLAHLTGLQTLYLRSMQVTDLAPLAHLTGLQTLYLSGTHVTDLAPLAHLAGLQTLFLSGTHVTDLAPLAHLTDLRALYLRDTRVTDLAPLAYLTVLETLDLSDTHVTDLAPLAHLTGLQALYLRNTQVTDLAPLAHLTGLRALDLSGTHVTDLAPLAHLTGLRALYFSDTQLTDLAPLAHLTGLRALYLRDTQFTDLAPLAYLTGLETLDISDAQVTDLSPLAHLTSLQELRLRDTEVTDLAPLAHLTSLQTLHLSDTEVTDLAPLAHLTSLQELHLRDTQVTDLAPLTHLTGLRALYLRDTQFTDLAPLAYLTGLETLDLSDTQVTDLSPLAHLTSLQTLHLSDTQVTDLASLVHLTGLQTLYLSGTQVTDLAPLAHLTGLQALHLRNTQVTDLAPLAHLTSLQTLHLSGTQVTDLAPLAHLTGLQALHLRDTQVTDLAPLLDVIRRGNPVKWSSEPGESNGIYVGDCPLINPPPEIAARGNDAILNYFAERARGEVDHLYEAKMLILGEGGAGKTSLLRRLYKPDEALPTEKETTRGIAIHKHEFKMKNGRAFRVNVWDFGGQQIYHATHQFFLTHRSLYVLVDDTRKDYKSVSDEGFKYWLELIDVFGGHSPTLIFQNEKDGRSKAIDFGGIKQRYDNVKELYAGNLDRRGAVDRVRDGIEFYAANLSHVGEEMPSRWIRVREEIEALAASKPYIPVEKYFEVYSGQIEKNETKALLLSRYLHDLGVFLHFQDDPLLRRTVILQNEWATNAAFRILDDEDIKKRLGRFNPEDCARVWKDSNYAQMHPELLALMQNFELCYELRDSSPQTWLAPQLLPPAKPEGLGTWARPDDLVLRYKYEFLPKGIISRLTVRLHRFVRDPEKAWTTGVLFEHDRTAALVEILPEGSEIELRARGPENKALLSVIAADLDALNGSFKGLRDKVGKRIPCNCKICRVSSIPQFFEQKALLRRKSHRVLTAQCEISFEDVDVMELLDGIKMEMPPDWAEDDSATGSNSAPGGPPRHIRIFLASSSELRQDRDQFDLHFRTQNDRLIKQGIYLEIVRWEYFLDAISETRLQDEYNKAIRECDIFVSLFFTKTGKFTEEEFDVAHRQFKSTRKPLIYTFFKNADFKTGSARKDDFNSLWTFQEKLTKLGHFCTGYNNTEDLLLQFRRQLDVVINQTHQAKADNS